MNLKPSTNSTLANNSHRQILITCALPYANGYVHIGHLVEYLQADFWNRFQKMRGHSSIYLCADDTHGTPIMVKARERGIQPEELIAQSFKEHTADFAGFQIEFDHYGSTHSEENRELSEEFYEKMKSKGHVTEKTIKQLFCEHDNMFLPDRFVKGICPKCGAQDQYGDSCDKCGATYSTSEVKSPYCSICRNPPILKDSVHIFFQLNHFKKDLQEWLPKHTSNEISKKMVEWFEEDLRDWDISRDEPYFGFHIPGTENPKKYFYVWVDAPMGYISTTKQWAKKNNRSFEEYWKSEKSEVYHFIGKDIVYFHTLFWPALLSSADYRRPTSVFVHGHLMVNGEKMSKSKGTFISARTYLNHLDPQFLRYYYATKINSGVDDLDLSMDDFSARVNSDLVGKITNLGSRGAQMLNKKLQRPMSQPDSDGSAVIAWAQSKQDLIAKHFEDRDFSKAMTEIREIADKANKYFDEKAPWKLTDAESDQIQKILTTTLNLFRILAIYLKPILPQYATQVEKLLNEPKPFTWASLNEVVTDREIQNYIHLAQRVDKDKIEAMIAESSAQNLDVTKALTKTATHAKASNEKLTSKNETKALPTNEFISIDDFNKIDLRIAKIISAEAVPEADKLLKLKVELEPGVTKQIFAGIKAAYEPEKLVGRLTVICANLQPRQMKFGLSEGMVLAAGPGGSDIFILSPDEGAKPGHRVK